MTGCGPGLPQARTGAVPRWAGPVSPPSKPPRPRGSLRPRERPPPGERRAPAASRLRGRPGPAATPAGNAAGGRAGRRPPRVAQCLGRSRERLRHAGRARHRQFLARATRSRPGASYPAGPAHFPAARADDAAPGGQLSPAGSLAGHRRVPAAGGRSPPGDGLLPSCWPASGSGALASRSRHLRIRASRSARKPSSAARLASTVARRLSCRVRHSRPACGARRRWSARRGS